MPSLHHIRDVALTIEEYRELEPRLTHPATHLPEHSHHPGPDGIVKPYPAGAASGGEK